MEVDEGGGTIFLGIIKDDLSISSGDDQDCDEAESEGEEDYVERAIAEKRGRRAREYLLACGL